MIAVPEEIRENAQKNIYTTWINNYLQVENLKVNDLYTDLADGVILPKLIQILWGEKISVSTSVKAVYQRESNINVVLNFLQKNGVNTSISAKDFSINDTRSHKAILGFIMEIIKKHSIDPIDYGGLKGKKALLKWCQDSSKSGNEVNNFSTSWESGEVLRSIIENYIPNFSSMKKISNFNFYPLTGDVKSCQNDEHINVVIASELYRCFNQPKQQQLDSKPVVYDSKQQYQDSKAKYTPMKQQSNESKPQPTSSNKKPSEPKMKSLAERINMFNLLSQNSESKQKPPDPRPKTYGVKQQNSESDPNISEKKTKLFEIKKKNYIPKTQSKEAKSTDSEPKSKIKKINTRSPKSIHASIREYQKIGNKETLTDYKPQVKEVCQRFNSLGLQKVILITMVGSYQTGKSSTIKRLTYYDDIEIGNGVDDQTKGAFLYGPFSYNEIRTNFGQNKCTEDINVFFVDTEGANGFLDDNDYETATRLITKLLAPFAAVSDIILSLSQHNISKPETKNLNELLEAVKLIRGKAWESIDLISLITNFPGYNPMNPNLKSEAFVRSDKYVHEKFPNIPFKKSIPLPQFNNLNKETVFQQGPEFQEGFKIFANKLIETIEKRKNDLVVDGTSMAAMFEELATNKNLSNLSELTNKIHNEGMASFYTRSYTRIIYKSVSDEISNINDHYMKYFANLQSGKNISNIEFNIDERSDRVISKVEKKIPDSFKILNEYQKDIQSISVQLQDYANQLLANNEQKIKEIQKQHICDMINSVLNNQLQLMVSDMEETAGLTFNEVYSLSFPNQIKETAKNEFERIKSSYFFNDDVIDEIELKIPAACDVTIKQSKEAAQEIAERNVGDASFWKLFAHKVTTLFKGEKIRP